MTSVELINLHKQVFCQILLLQYDESLSLGKIHDKSGKKTAFLRDYLSNFAGRGKPHYFLEV